MKKELNAAVKKSTSKIDEIFLFRAMAKEFNHSIISKSTYVKEIHGNKSKVEFSSKYKLGGSANTELGDLLIFTFDKATQELRMCILQAKYKQSRYYRFLNSKANLFQWELLHDKPPIINKSKFHFPPDILNFRTDYKSISAYGIFYHDNILRDIDFLFTLPDFFVPHSMPRSPIANGDRCFNFRCPFGLGSPNNVCTKGITRKEAISTCSIDVFENQVLLCKVGVPIPNKTPIGRWVLTLLNNMREYADNPEVINELLNFYNDDITEYTYSFDETPSALIVITDSNKYEELCMEYMKDERIHCKNMSYKDYI